jgi:hypothetical protein
MQTNSKRKKKKKKKKTPVKNLEADEEEGNRYLLIGFERELRRRRQRRLALCFAQGSVGIL